MIEPRNDYLLVRRIEMPQGLVTLTDADKSIYGEVIRIGPGRWIPGTWWKVKNKWEWFDGYRDLMRAHPGQKVLFNSKWNDLAADHYEDLPYGADAQLHLIQQADIFAIVHGKVIRSFARGNPLDAANV
jgi:hypothetical protein